MRTHLFSVFGVFFICYFVFLFFYTNYFYMQRLEYNVSQQYDLVFENRLKESSDSLSSVVYYLDSYGIDSVLRLSDVYQRVFKEVQMGYYK